MEENSSLVRPSGPLSAKSINSLTLRIGRRAYPVADLADASRKTLAAVHALMATGARMSDTFKTPLLYEGERLVGHVSQNGRVWPGHPRDWKPGAKPLHEAVY